MHPPEGVPLLRAEGELWDPPISGQGAEATPQGLSTAAFGLDRANFRICAFVGGSGFGGVLRVSGQVAPVLGCEPAG